MAVFRFDVQMYVRALALVTLCALASALPFDGSKRISRIALGSCNNAKKPQPLWPEIASYSPDAFVWLGDITCTPLTSSPYEFF